MKFQVFQLFVFMALIAASVSQPGQDKEDDEDDIFVFDTLAPNSNDTDVSENPTETPIDESDSPSATVSSPPTVAPNEPPPPDSSCSGQPCDPNLADPCSCRPGLECRQRRIGVYQCSAAPRRSRERLSGALGIGGAAGRQRGRAGFFSF